MGQKSTKRLIHILSLEDATQSLIGKTPSYYFGHQSNLIRDKQIKAKNIGDFLAPHRDEIRDFLVNVDSYFSSDLFSLGHTCSANRYLTRLCDDAMKGRALIEQLHHKNSDIFLIVDHGRDLHKYAKFLTDNGLRVQYIDGVTTKLRRFLAPLKSYTASLKALLSDYFQSAFVLNKTTLSDTIFICWVTDSTIDKTDLFSKNKYFGSMPESLKKDMNPTFLGLCLRGFPNTPGIIKSTIKRKLPIKFLREFMTFSDVLYAVSANIGLLFRKPRKIIFKDVDYSAFVSDSLKKDYFGGHLMDGILHYRLFQKFMKSLPEKARIIYPFENQPWERSMLLAASQSGKQLNLSGYQFFAIPDNFFIHSFSDKTLKKGIFPSAILTSDNHSNNSIAQRVKTIPLGNYRYHNLLVTDKNHAPAFEKKKALCSLFLDENEALNLASKALEITHSIGLPLIINFHPLLSKDILREIEALAKPYPHATFSDQGVSLLLPQVSVLLYNSSSVCFEAALQGIPAIYIPCDNLVNLDRFPSLGKSYEETKDYAQLLEELLRDKKFYEKYRQDLRQRAKTSLLSLDLNQLEKIKT